MNRAATIVMLSVATLALLGCGDSNPLIGKWVPAKDQGECDQIVWLDFTEKTVSVRAVRVPDEPAPVIYFRDGTQHVATVQVGNKKSFTFEKTTDGLTMRKPLACRFVKATATDLKNLASSIQRSLEDASYCVGFHVAQLEKPINHLAIASIRKKYDLFVSLALDLLSKDGAGRTPSIGLLSADPDLSAPLMQGRTDWKQVLDAKQDDRFPLILKYTEKCDKLQSGGFGK